ncbi:MAG: DegT/DnrJ/EryC1/StrS family aminotransferase [Candidatus Hydrogenedentes bacterium]|nr:DegT/DnrJ/EryC1/StrS family aminotransferase [Candidatus Hydrogenedentota bacterium]
MNFSHQKQPRREFIKTAGLLSSTTLLTNQIPKQANPRKLETLALNGGKPAVTITPPDATKWPIYTEEEIQAVSELLRNPSYAPIAEFEEAWKKYFECPFAKAHCNGTSALTSTLFALDLPPGSEILVPDYSTWFPVVPMRFFKYVPVFVDINPKTLNIDVEDCKKRLSPKTKAIMPVHWYGVPCDLDYIDEFAKEHGLEVIEDASHAHGAKLKNVLIGKWGRMAGFSLQTTKPLPAIEGGMAMYKNIRDYERSVTYGNYDLPKTFPEDSPYRKYQGTAFGGKLRIHPVAAILGRIQLKYLDQKNKTGVAQMKKLNDAITQLPGLTAQYVRPDAERVYYSRNLLFIDEAKAGASRSAIVKALKAEGVDIVEYQWTLLHTYPIFSESQWWEYMPVLPKEGTPKGCDEANKTTISLPYFTTEQPELVEQYIHAFEKVWAHIDELK